MKKHAKYDHEVIQVFANKLYAQANSIIASSTLAGTLLGGIAGYLLLQSPVSAIIGAAFIGLFGFSIGKTRAFNLKLQAQTSLCLVQTEKNTRK